MHKGSQLLLAALFAASVAACDRPANRDNAGTPGAEGTAGSAATNLDMGERNFVKDQINDGTKEIELGKLAAERASLPAVKEFGSMMVQDHTRAGTELKQIAAREKVDLDADDTRDDARDAVKKLADLKGSEFDREYIDMMVKDHQDAVDALQDQAQNAEHPAVKQWAASTLPRIKHHLEQAQQLQNRLKNSDNRGNPGQ